MKTFCKPRNILVTFDISSIAGRDQLSGVLKYLHTRLYCSRNAFGNKHY